MLLKVLQKMSKYNYIHIENNCVSCAKNGNRPKSSTKEAISGKIVCTLESGVNVYDEMERDN